MHSRFALIYGHGAARHQLRETARDHGLAVAADAEFLLVTEARAATVVGRHSAIVGRMWTADCQPVDAIGEDIEDAARGGDWHALPSLCWGNFVLFTTDRDGHPRVYRDPSGNVGAFHLSLAGQDLFFSDAQFAHSLDFLGGTEVDLRFAVHWLQFPFLKTIRSGLRHVDELLPGTWRHCSAGDWRMTIGWDPWRYATGSAAFRDPRAAAMRLRDTALQVIPAQLRGDRPALQLSGGLDSSIIAICSQLGGIDCAGLHFVASSADGDERRYAKEVAELSAIPLATFFEDDLQIDLQKIPLGIVPGANPVLAPIERAIVAAVPENGAALLVDGGGGDNLFCYLTSAAPVADALRRGPPGETRRAIASVAEITHSSWWDVIMAAVRLRVRSQMASPRWHEDPTFLNREIRLPAPDRHPWLERRRGALDGRYEHVETIAQIQHFFDRRTDWSVPVIHPLMAQPLLELCLRIPSWMWIARGRDRSVARTAFASLLPQSVLARRMKGSLQGYIQRSFEKLRPELRALVLDGELRRTHIIDAAAVERTFAQATLPDAGQLRLTELAALEQWMRSWRA